MILEKFKLIHAFIVVLLTCNDEDRFKIESTRVVTTLSHSKSMRTFQTLNGSLLHSPRSNRAELQTHPRFYGWPCCLQNEKNQIIGIEWSQHYSLIFKCSKAANAEVNDGILPKFKLIQAFMVGLIT